MADPYIELDSTSLSAADADAELTQLLRALNLRMTPDLRIGRQQLIVKEGGETHELSVPNLLAELHLEGTCELHRLRWAAADPYGSIAADVPEGLPLIVASGPRNSPPLIGPGYVTTDVVSDVLADVLFYRQLVANESRPGNMYEHAFRAYRAYLGASITAIDSYLNRLSWFAVNDGRELSPSNQRSLARKNLPLDAKLRQWMPILVPTRALDESAPEWRDYQLLKKARNDVVHMNEPDIAFAVHGAADVLNLCRRGVGGVLLSIMQLLGHQPLPAALRVSRAVAHVSSPKSSLRPNYCPKLARPGFGPAAEPPAFSPA